MFPGLNASINIENADLVVFAYLRKDCPIHVQQPYFIEKKASGYNLQTGSITNHCPFIQKTARFKSTTVGALPRNAQYPTQTSKPNVQRATQTCNAQPKRATRNPNAQRPTQTCNPNQMGNPNQRAICGNIRNTRQYTQYAEIYAIRGNIRGWGVAGNAPTAGWRRRDDGGGRYGGWGVAVDIGRCRQRPNDVSFGIFRIGICHIRDKRNNNPSEIILSQ